MTMTATYVLMLAGAGAMIGVPVRLFQLTRGSLQVAYSQLNLFSKIYVTIGLAGLFLGSLLWIGVAFVTVMVFTDATTPRIWGTSELAATSSLFGALYLLVELLLLPATIRQIRNKRAVSAEQLAPD